MNLRDHKVLAVAAETVAMVLVLSAVYLGALFVTVSFTSTGSGPIKWNAGLEYVKEAVWPFQ